MIMVIDVAAADCPLLGVKKYVVVVVLFIAGDQVPETPLDDEDGNAGIDDPLQ